MLRRFIIISCLLLNPLLWAAKSKNLAHEDCADLLGKIAENSGTQVTSLNDLDLKIPAHREAIARAIDSDPNQWYLLKRYYPQYAAQLEPILFVPLEKVGPFAGMGEAAIDLALMNMGGLQLETQCCVQCPWCGFSINKKSKYQQLPVSIARTIFRRLADLNTPGDRSTSLKPNTPNLQMLYYESDPFDYRMPLEVGSSTIYHYPEIHVMADGFTGRSPYVSTAVPKGKEQIVLDFIDGRLNRDIQVRLSYSSHNRDRLRTPDPKTGKSFDSEIRDRLGKQNVDLSKRLEIETQFFSSQTDEFLINALYEANATIKSNRASRFLRPDPKNPEALLLYGSDFVLVRKLAAIPKKTLADEFKQRTVNFIDARKFLMRVLPIIRILGRANYTQEEGPFYKQDTEVRNIGRAFASEDPDELTPGIGCFDGVLVTPTKIYNLVQLPGPTPEFKDAQVVVEVSKIPPLEQLPIEAPIQEVLKYGVVEAKGVKALMEKPLSDRDSFYLLDFQGNRHFFEFHRVGDGFVASRRISESPIEPGE